MDKYEFNIKAEQMRKMADQGDYITAMQIADTIDWRRVRNANLLASVADIYEHNKEYAEAKDILLLAFERAPVGKRFLFKLTEISVKAGHIQDAQEFYREFCEMSPDDSRQYLLRYMILKSKGASAEQLITSLEEYTSVDVDEKWLFELAKLYSEAGYEEDCVKTCDKIMLLFGLGQYVDKAKELKQKYRGVSIQQPEPVVSESSKDIENPEENDTYEYIEDDAKKFESMESDESEDSEDEIQIVDDIEVPEETSKVELNNYHMIIEAKTREEGFKIAVNEIKYFHDKYGYDFKVAKTNSERLNEKGFSAFKSKIEGKDLIIEDAGALTYKVVDEIDEYIDSLEDSSSVVLVDVIDHFDRMAEDRPLFIKRFDLVSDIDDEEDLVEDVDLKDSNDNPVNEDRDEDISSVQTNAERPRVNYDNNRVKTIDDIVHIEKSSISETNDSDEETLPKDFYKEMDIDDFATYAQTYAKQIDCVLPGKTVLALYERIEIMQEDGIALNKASAEELIEEAADKAEKVGIGKKLTGVFHPKYDKEGRLILREECFVG
ncbi:tetratricopeptide repeat protein [Oribacterium sp. P6A1]|uniref:tetratricopeptide repeat protein n=1 Tax=Oribacterium sp. P6A1 TaxID=1410612 RepID=UPI0005635403|nr:hypothetical protein [Oribacterium sp. P6A1]